MGTFLKVVGMVGALAGLAFLFFAIRMDVAVNLDGQGYVANFQLMQNQIARLILGGFLLVTGVLSAVAGVIVDNLREQTDRILRDEAPPPEPEIYG